MTICFRILCHLKLSVTSFIEFSSAIESLFFSEKKRSFHNQRNINRVVYDLLKESFLLQQDFDCTRMLKNGKKSFRIELMSSINVDAIEWEEKQKKENFSNGNSISEKEADRSTGEISISREIKLNKTFCSRKTLSHTYLSTELTRSSRQYSGVTRSARSHQIRWWRWR